MLSPPLEQSQSLPTAAAGENRRTIGKACTLLPAAAGGVPPDAPALWGHAAKDREAAVASRIGESKAEQISVTREDGRGSVSGIGWETAISGRCVPAGRETGRSRRRWKHPGPRLAKTLPREVVWSTRRVEIGA